MISISIVVPVYRGEKFIFDLFDEVNNFRKNLETINSPYQISELIFVNDDSKDGSLLKIYEIKSNNPWVTLVNLSKNFGQHQATAAGIMYSSGDWVLTIDEDLQHHPSLLEVMLKKAVEKNSDIVYVSPISGVHDSMYRDLSSKLIKKLISKITKNKHIAKFNSFRLIRGNIARGAASSSIDQTYLDISLTWFTDRIIQIKHEIKDNRYINEKQSGYSFFKLISHAKRLVLNSDIKIIRIIPTFGVITSIISVFLILYAIFKKIFFPDLINSQGWTSLFVMISLFGGINVFITGIALEYISVILMQTHGKPKFFEIDRSSDEILRNWFFKK